MTVTRTFGYPRVVTFTLPLAPAVARQYTRSPARAIVAGAQRTMVSTRPFAVVTAEFTTVVVPVRGSERLAGSAETLRGN